ncbi:MAG: hypothetical protein Q4C58_09630 [Eubacteriales bacterium]|nr:hypothetical protein [Eubacteriales bacterium]
MEKDVILELYYGNISPIDLNMMEKETYLKHSEYLEKASEEFAKKLPSDLKAEFRKLCEAEMKADEILHRDGFCKGFQLGLKLTAEALLEE